MRDYFIYDGRANYDVEDACVVECFDAKNDAEAKRYHEIEYKDHDTVLMDKNDNIIL